MFVVKSGHAPELSGANCHAKLCHSKHLVEIFIQWCEQNFVNWRKDIYSGHTEKPKESPTVRNCSNQEERRHDKRFADTVNV